MQKNIFPGRRAFLLVALGALLTAFSPLRAEGSAATPREVVARFDQALLKTMKAGSVAGIRGRYAIMIQAVRGTFDLPFIGRLMLGHYWATFPPAQRQAFLKTFSRLVAATYAHNFNGYGGQQIRIEHDVVHGSAAYVYTIFAKPGSGSRHRFDYVLRQVDGSHWRIVNVVADGVSDMAIKREEYQHFLRKESFAALMGAMGRQFHMMMSDSHHRP